MAEEKKDIGGEKQNINEEPEKKLSFFIENIMAQQVDPIKKYEEIHFVDKSKPVWNYSLLTDEDVINFQKGTNYQLYKKFGSHSLQVHNSLGYILLCMGAQCNGRFGNWQFQ